MKAKPIIPRKLANQDVYEAIEHYLNEKAEQAALGFINALEQAYAHIKRHPATGSPRYAHELNFPDPRSCSLTRDPHLVFYIERGDHIGVWRVLHRQRDTPAWLGTETVPRAGPCSKSRTKATPTNTGRAANRFI